MKGRGAGPLGKLTAATSARVMVVTPTGIAHPHGHAAR